MGRGDGWAVKQVSCLSALYFEHHFIYQKLTGFNSRAFVFFIVMLKHVLEYLFL